MKKEFVFSTPELPPEKVAELEKARQKKDWQHFTPEFVDRQSSTVSPSRVGRAITEATKLAEQVRITQERARVRVKTDDPITIFAIGDVHYGNVQTDHRRFHQEINKIEETPGTYVIFTGNLIDNAIPSKYPDLMLENAIPPDQQVSIMRSIIKKLNLKGKILGAVAHNCHEGWTRSVSGQDLNVLLYDIEGRNFPVLENGGRIDLRVGDQTYRIAVYHQTGPFESNFNPEHAVRQMNRLQQNMEADVVIAGHRHRGSASMNYEGTGKARKPVAYIRSGTYKGIDNLQDRFTRERSGRTGEPSGESVTLFPDKKRMETHLEFETGILAQLAHSLFGRLKR